MTSDRLNNKYNNNELDDKDKERRMNNGRDPENGVRKTDINARSSSSSSSSGGGKKVWWACLYTNHKTRKRKVWQDGKILISPYRAFLHVTAPGNSGILDQVDMTPAQVSTLFSTAGNKGSSMVGQTLESEQYLISLEGPWKDQDHTTSIKSNQSINTLSRPYYSTSMQKLLQGGKKKKIRSQTYIPPPPQEEHQIKLESSWQRKRKAPLQPGQLQKQYYGNNTSYINYHNNMNNTSNYGISDNNNAMITRHDRSQISGLLQRRNYHDTNGHGTNPNNSQNSIQNQSTMYPNQNNPFLLNKNPTRNNYIDQNISPQNTINGHSKDDNPCRNKKIELVSNDFDPKSFYGSDDESHISENDSKDHDNHHNKLNMNQTQYPNNYNHSNTNLTTDYPSMTKNRKEDNIASSINLCRSGNHKTDSPQQQIVAGTNPSKSSIAKVTPNIDTNLHNNDKNGKNIGNNFLQQFIAGTNNNNNNINKNNTTNQSNSVKKNNTENYVQDQSSSNQQAVVKDNGLMTVSNDKNSKNETFESLKRSTKTDKSSNDYEPNSDKAISVVTTKDDLLELFGTNMHDNDDENEITEEHDKSNGLTERNDHALPKNDNVNSLWTNAPSLTIDNDHILSNNDKEMEISTTPKSDSPTLRVTNNNDAMFKFSIPSASSSSGSSSTSSNSSSSSSSQSDEEKDNK